MGVHVVTDGTYAALYDSVSMTAFGPVFSDEELFVSPEAAAQDFLDWLQDRGLNVRSRQLVRLVADRSVWATERRAQRRRAEREGADALSADAQRGMGTE